MPAPGTLDALVRRHEAFLHRLDGGAFTPVPALTVFAVVGYRRSTDLPDRPFVAFELWQPADVLASLPAGKSKHRPFDPAAYAVTVAAMVRHCAAEAARSAGWKKERINSFIHGHSADGRDRLRGGADAVRFAYLPHPLLEQRRTPGGRRVEHCGSIRRVLVVGPPGSAAEVDWAGRALSGRELVDQASGKPVALLTLISKRDSQLQGYLQPSSVWSTVTPVVLPGHDEGKPTKAEGLLRRAFVHAGVSPELLEKASLEWRLVGFRPGVELSTRYQRPQQMLLPRLHVRVCWPEPIHGPLAVWAGRYRGLGLFAAEATR